MLMFVYSKPIILHCTTSEKSGCKKNYHLDSCIAWEILVWVVTNDNNDHDHDHDDHLA